MAKQTNYVQCILKKNNKIQTSWIPERYAVIGKYLKLLENNIWENGWQVISNGVKVSKNSLEILSQDHKRTRTSSDI
jgi:hypothetical protein